MPDMTPEQIRAMFAQQNGTQTPKLHSSIFQRFKPSGNLSAHGKSHLHKFADATKKGIGKANQKRIEKQYEKTAKLHTINASVNTIINSDDSDSEKIAKLQRLLGDNHNDIDSALMSRIQQEMKSLHGTNSQTNNVTDHAERLQHESAENNPSSNPYWNPASPEPKKIGHDYQTGEDIFDDDSREQTEHDEQQDEKFDVADFINTKRLEYQGII